jgi:transposase
MQAQIAFVDEKIAASAGDPEKAAPCKARKARALPQSLPRVERADVRPGKPPLIIW